MKTPSRFASFSQTTRAAVRAAVGVFAVAASVCQAQDSQFAFDLNGNLSSRYSASSNPPVILAHPQPQVARPGELASFFVVAANTRDLTFQWRFNGTNVSGATSDALLRTNVSAASEGLYSVVLVNGSGSVTSAPAMLWLDTDGDDLADSWEQSYFGGLAQNPGSDFDGDGVSNLTEFDDGTSPTNSASAQFRLNVMSDGGNVVIAPAKLSYTNGEIVTLTASALPPEIFHAWTGSIFTRTNPISLVMTNDKTLFAHFNPFMLTWTNAAGGDWHNPSNWSPNLVPSAADDLAPLPAVTITINAAAACGHLTFTGGTLTGTGVLTVHGEALWTGGTMSGSGRTIIAPGATLTIAHSFNLTLDGRIFENAGTTLWTGAGGMILANTTRITNRPGALFEFRSSPNFGTAGGGARSFDNAGLVRKTTSTGTMSFGTVPFNNYGSFELETGTLTSSSPFNSYGTLTLWPGTINQFAAGGSASGTIFAPSNAVVEWVGSPFALNPGVQLTGDGLYQISVGPVSFNTNVTVQRLVMASHINGSGDLTISSNLTWTAGSMGGGGRTLIVPSAMLSLPNPFNVTLDTRILENAGTMLWTGAGGMLLANTTRITNRPGALIEFRSAVNFGTSGGGTRSFDNAGLVRKTNSTGTLNFGTVPFNNYGSFELETGTVTSSSPFNSYGTLTLWPGTINYFAAGGSASGTIYAPSGAVVDWIGSPFALNAGVQLNGDGLYQISVGPVSFNTNVTVQRLAMASHINGSGDLTISSNLTWTAGSMGGGGRTLIVPSATLSLPNPFNVTLDTRILENAGTMLWTGAGGMFLANTTRITNRPGALIEFRSALNFGTLGGGTRSFDNAGLVRKTNSTGTLNFGTVPFNNYGSFELETGTVTSSSPFNSFGTLTLWPGTINYFAAGGSASGTIYAPSGAVVDWIGSPFALNAGVQLNGDGLYQISTGTASINTDVTVQRLIMANSISGSGNLTISSNLTWTGGTMGGGGRTLIVPSATLTMANPFNVALDTRVLENAGTVLWTGGGGMVLANTTIITNRPGALFEFRNAVNFGTSGGGTRSFDNAGILRKTTSSGAVNFGTLPFNNYGTLDIRNGIVTVNGGFTASGSSLLNCVLGGTTAGTGYGQLQKSATINLSGALSVELLPGFVPAANDAFTVVSAGTRSGTFSSFTYPDNRVALTLTNTPSSVILTVTNVFPVPQPVMLTPQLVGSNALLSWTATSNVTYRLERIGEVATTNWTSVAGDVTTTSNTASKLDPLSPSNQLYRVRVLP